MEFWGVEVKSREPLKVQPAFGKLIHLSQAAIGEVKDVKEAEHVSLRLKVGNMDSIIGALSARGRTQLTLDLVFEKEFELSHDLNTGSVYFMGYMIDSNGELDEDSGDAPEGTYKHGVILAIKGPESAAVAKALSKQEDSDSDSTSTSSSDSDSTSTSSSDSDSTSTSSSDSDSNSDSEVSDMSVETGDDDDSSSSSDGSSSSDDSSSSEEAEDDDSISDEELPQDTGKWL